MAPRVGIKLEPPYETSGNGTPVIGNSPSTAPILSVAWPMIQQPTPAAAGQSDCELPA